MSIHRSYHATSVNYEEQQTNSYLKTFIINVLIVGKILYWEHFVDGHKGSCRSSYQKSYFPF